MTPNADTKLKILADVVITSSIGITRYLVQLKSYRQHGVTCTDLSMHTQSSTLIHSFLSRVPQGAKVMWYVISDSRWVRQCAALKYGAKVLSTPPSGNTGCMLWLLD